MSNWRISYKDRTVIRRVHIKSKQTGEGNTRKITKSTPKKVFNELQKIMGLKSRRGKGKMNYITGDSGRTIIDQGVQSRSKLDVELWENTSWVGLFNSVR